MSHASRQTVNDMVSSLKLVPVDSGHTHGVAAGIYDLIAAGMPVSRALRKGSAGHCKNKDDGGENKNARRRLAGRRTDTHLDTPWREISFELKDQLRSGRRRSWSVFPTLP